MSPALVIAGAIDRLAGLGLAWSATWTPAAGGSAVACTLTVLEAPDAPQQAHGQHARVRSLDVYVLAAEVAAPAHADQVAVAAGPHAGTWSVLGIERRDSVGAVVRLRATSRERTAGATTREVLR